MAYVELIPVERCRRDGGTFVELQGRELAVFLLDEARRVVVIDNSCPHAGGNLSGGASDGRTVTCPWHQWTFELETGVCTTSALARVTRYPAEIRGGSVWVDPSPGKNDPPRVLHENGNPVRACSSAVRAGDS